MQVPSSTSSSDASGLPRPRLTERATTGWFCLGCLAAILAFELGVALAFPVPRDWRRQGGALSQYFQYGQSIKRKLDRTVAQPGEEPAPIIQAGWLASNTGELPENWAEYRLRTVIYGSSFTNRIASEMVAIDPTVGILARAGPGAPLSHSFAIFEADPQRELANHVIVGVLSSSIAYLQAMSGLGFTSESPAPYTFPRFTVENGALVRIDPVITSEAAFVDSFRKRSSLWSEHVASLRRHDGYWNRFVFESSPLDRSTLANLIRRAWSKRVVNERQADVYDPTLGFKTWHPALAAVPELLRFMHNRCARDGQRFTVILLHARGEPGHLAKWLSPLLKQGGIDVLSTSDFFNSRDALNFEPDSHYLPPLDRELGRALLERLNQAEPATGSLAPEPALTRRAP